MQVRDWQIIGSGDSHKLKDIGWSRTSDGRLPNYQSALVAKDYGGLKDQSIDLLPVSWPQKTPKDLGKVLPTQSKTGMAGAFSNLDIDPYLTKSIWYTISSIMEISIGSLPMTWAR